MYYEKKIMVGESAEKFVEATDKVVEAISEGCTLDMFMDMDAKTLTLVQSSMKLVGTYKELCMQQAKAIDQLTDMVGTLNTLVRSMDDKIDKLGKKNITEK